MSSLSIKSLFALCVIALFSFTISAQDAFQRLYSVEDDSQVNLGIESALNGGFYMLNALVPQMTTDPINTLIVTKHDVKGSLVWASEYTFKDGSFVTNLKTMDLATLDNDTLLIVGSSVDFTTGGLLDERFIIKMTSQNGDVVSAQTISDQTGTVLPVTFPIGLRGFDSNYAYLASHSNVDTLGIQYVNFDSNDTILSQRAYFVSNEDQTFEIAALVDAKTTVDSNYMMTFISDNQSSKTGLLKIDPAGNVLTSDEYSISPDSLLSFIMQTVAIETTKDTGVVQTGIVFDLLSQSISSFIIKSDLDGNIEWSKMIDGTSQAVLLQANDVIQSSQDEYVLMLKYVSLADFSQGDVAIMFDEDGNVLRQWDYGSDNGFFITINPDGTAVTFGNGEIVNIEDGGMAYGTVGLDIQGGQLLPYAIKMDSSGAAFCQDTFALEVVRDYEFTNTSLGIGTTDFSVRDTFEVNKDRYEDFSLPVLQLLDTFFCPQDPIMVTLDATLEDASTYEWEDGSTSPVRLVTEEGEYSVTVTFDTKVCYTLCDTSSITQRDFPEATIDAQFFTSCAIDSFNLIAGSNNPLTGFVWSTGDSLNRVITGQEFGEYSVTVTDFCDNTAEASIEVNQIEPLALDVSIAEFGECEDKALQVNITPGTSLGVLEYMWNTGDTGSILSNIESGGTYAVTVTDDCSSDVDSLVLAEAFEFPNIFFPNNPEHDVNQSFGPYLDCPDFFEGQNYSLEVYSRFGNKMFETNNINERWNGVNDGDFAPRDVYMYQWSYMLSDGTEVNGEGTVTLYR